MPTTSSQWRQSTASSLVRLSPFDFVEESRAWVDIHHCNFSRALAVVEGMLFRNDSGEPIVVARFASWRARCAQRGGVKATNGVWHDVLTLQNAECVDVGTGQVVESPTICAGRPNSRSAQRIHEVGNRVRALIATL